MNGYKVFPDGRVWSKKSNSFLTPDFQRRVTIHNQKCSIVYLVAKQYVPKVEGKPYAVLTDNTPPLSPDKIIWHDKPLTTLEYYNLYRRI